MSQPSAASRALRDTRVVLLFSSRAHHDSQPSLALRPRMPSTSAGRRSGLLAPSYECTRRHGRQNGSASYGRRSHTLTIMSQGPSCPLSLGIVSALPVRWRLLHLIQSWPANFRPYTYWHLVILSCPISQHLASIFVFLAVFMRIRQRLLDPRALVWISAGVFMTGYISWELLEYGTVSREARRTFRASLHTLSRQTAHERMK